MRRRLSCEARRGEPAGRTDRGRRGRSARVGEERQRRSARSRTQTPAGAPRPPPANTRPQPQPTSPTSQPHQPAPPHLGVFNHAAQHLAQLGCLGLQQRHAARRSRLPLPLLRALHRLRRRQRGGRAARRVTGPQMRGRHKRHVQDEWAEAGESPTGSGGRHDGPPRALPPRIPAACQTPARTAGAAPLANKLRSKSSSRLPLACISRSARWRSVPPHLRPSAASASFSRSAPGGGGCWEGKQVRVVYRWRMGKPPLLAQTH